MARPSEEAIETFISITGVTEPVAVQKLQEHGGDLNAAVNAHFSEGDRNVVHETSVSPAQDDLMEIDDPIEVPVPPRSSPLSPLSGPDLMNPFSILDPHFRRSLLDSGPNLANPAPFVSHPREVREIPIEVKDGGDGTIRPSDGPIIEDVTGSDDLHGQGTRGTVMIADEDADNNAEDLSTQAIRQNEVKADPFDVNSRETRARPSAPQLDDLSDYGNDIEEQMLRAAIEASKRDAQEIPHPGSQQRKAHSEDAEIAHAVSLSLQTAELEKTKREQEDKVGALQAGTSNPAVSNGRFELRGSSVQDEDEEVEEQPLVLQRSRRPSSHSVGSTSEVGVVDVSPSSSPDQTNVHRGPQHNGNAFQSDEWGGISSEEHDEAVMLEAAMFGGIPEGTGHHHAPHQLLQSDASSTRWIPRPPSPSLQAQRLIREQQDDEYLASLEADREKEMKAKQEADARRLQEEAARKAILEEERRKEEESRRKLEEEQEVERQLAAKEASLPQEPASDDEDAVTLLVRMPDGSRRGRRFLKSDRLQSLFDFIDIGRVVKPGSYRLVRPYPRRAFSDGESSLALNELGLTSKQEALFLELVY